MRQTAIIGTQWGDEGKGKIIDLLADKFAVVVRFAGGDNAGHTVIVNGQKHVLHLLPSAILRSEKICVIGSGVVINLESLLEELDRLKITGTKTARLFISEKCHLVLPKHLKEDQKKGKKIGTTARGIGPTYRDATARVGTRLMDLETRKKFRLSKIVRQFEQLKNYPRVQIGNVSMLLDQMTGKNQSILYEGAQGTLLDISHGTYPFVTSSHPTTGGIFIGTGFRPRKLKVIGVVKAYTTRVGKGPFPTEQKNKLGSYLRKKGGEYGATTGRARRCGWLDLTILRYAKIINGLDSLVVTKLDVLDDLEEISVCTGYKIDSKIHRLFPTNLEVLKKIKPIYRHFSGWKTDTTGVRKLADLPKAARKYLGFIEQQTDLKIYLIGVGPDRRQIIKV